MEVVADELLPRGSSLTGATLARSLIHGGQSLQADVLEAQPRRGVLFVETAPDEAIEAGPADLHPFDYLRAPALLLESPSLSPLLPRLAERLAASAGEVVPREQEAGAWSRGWGIVWGPPGTGKTWTLGQEVARLLEDPQERVLVLSTTHKAADQAALELGQAALHRGRDPEGLRRVGRTLNAEAFREAGLAAMLPVRDRALADQIDALHAAIASTEDPGQCARLQRRLRPMLRAVPGLPELAWEPGARALVATLHAGLSLVTRPVVADPLIEEGVTPFTTVVLDEAGLVSRASAAVASLLAARRVVLVGDPRQLSPIARATRSMPRPVMRWVARSALDHLEASRPLPHVQRLGVQRRMHPDIRAGISALQYDEALADHESVRERTWEAVPTLARRSRLLWIPVDRVVESAASQSQRAPGGSRVRRGTLRVLERLLAACPELADVPVLFVSPYRAQCDAVEAWASARKLPWIASTVHAQQGAQADVVVFDTVHASSTAWDPAEWKRLVNVGLSRARHAAVLVATQDEVGQAWMRPLRPHLTTVVPDERGLHAIAARTTQGDLFAAQRGSLAADDGPVRASTDEGSPPADDDRLGAQIARRRGLRSVLSREQRRLVDRDLSDAGPRLVRGVAGSGKTLVLARWAVRALQGLSVPEVLVVYANAALGPLLQHMIADAWEETTDGQAVPWDRVRLRHIADLLEGLRREAGLPAPAERDRWNYDRQAEILLAQGPVAPRYPAILVDEAQDLGHHPLELLVQLAEPRGDQRPVMIFYDNAQNIYGRSTPNWRRLGLDMRGRSDVMRESFRTTRPILELALTLCDQLRPIDRDEDIREQIRQGLIRVVRDGDIRRFRVDYCEVGGERPRIDLFEDPHAERRAVSRQIRAWIREDAVRPNDIRVVVCRREDGEALAHTLRAHGVDAAFVTSSRLGQAQLAGDPRVLVSTAHSFKGYDAEVVVVAGVDRFARGGGGVLVDGLYVALTRARSVLWVTGSAAGDERVVGAVRRV